MHYAELKDGDMGHYELGTIKVSAQLALRLQARVAVHEFGHGIWQNCLGPDEQIDDEQFARLFELGIVDLVRNNWPLIEFVRQTSKTHPNGGAENE